MASPRIVVAGIGDTAAMPVLHWAALMARPRDTLRIVHAYAPVPYAASDWTLPVEDEAVMRQTVTRHVRDAGRRLQAERHDLRVETVLGRGTPSRIMSRFAGSASLIVVGSPHHCATHLMLTELAAHAACPLLVAPALDPATKPERGRVTALLRDLTSDGPVIETAAAEAAQKRSPLVVLRPWEPPEHTDERVGEELDEQLVADFLADHLHHYPKLAVTVERRLGDPVTVLTREGNRTELLFIGHKLGPTSDWVALDHAAETALKVRTAPTILVRAA